MPATSHAVTAEQQKGREEHASVKGGRVIGEGDKGAKREQKGAKREPTRNLGPFCGPNWTFLDFS